MKNLSSEIFSKSLKHVVYLLKMLKAEITNHFILFFSVLFNFKQLQHENYPDFLHICWLINQLFSTTFNRNTDWDPRPIEVRNMLIRSECCCDWSLPGQECAVRSEVSRFCFRMFLTLNKTDVWQQSLKLNAPTPNKPTGRKCKM